MTRYVFTTHELPHRWATCSRLQGAHSRGAVCFDRIDAAGGDTESPAPARRVLYSYSAPIGVIFEVGYTGEMDDAGTVGRVQQPFAVLTTHHWSITTSGHQSRARQAVSHFATEHPSRVFYVSGAHLPQTLGDVFRALCNGAYEVGIAPYATLHRSRAGVAAPLSRYLTGQHARAILSAPIVTYDTMFRGAHERVVSVYAAAQRFYAMVTGDEEGAGRRTREHMAERAKALGAVSLELAIVATLLASGKTFKPADRAEVWQSIATGSEPEHMAWAPRCWRQRNEGTLRRIAEARPSWWTEENDAGNLTPEAAAERLALWRAGKLYSLPTALRQAPDGSAYARVATVRRSRIVETSMGARVPYQHARGLLHLALSLRLTSDPGTRDRIRARAVGYPVGAHSLNVLHDDGAVTVGCHYLSWEELERVAIAEGILDAEGRVPGCQATAA